jgi:hypothetical protein
MSKSSLIADSVSSNALTTLKEQGFIVDLEVDLSRPTIPSNITELGDEDLMELYTKFVAYSDFINTQLSCAIIDEKELERQIELAEATTFLTLSTATSKLTTVRPQVASDEDVVQLKEEHMQKFAYRKLIETMANNYDRGSSVCSRELTRRTSNDNFKTRAKKFTT